MKNTCKHILNIALVVVVAAPLLTYGQEMTSGSYKMQSDSINFAGARSSSASYTLLTDTLGEVSTGDISSANFGGSIGFQAMLVAVSNDFTPPSAPPTISAAPVTSSSIEVTWGASTDNVAVTRYYIYRDGIRVNDVATFPRIYVDTGLTANTTYSYNVSAIDNNDNESLWSATTTATTLSSASPGASSGGGSSITPNLSDLVITPSDTIALVTFKTNVSLKAEVSWGQNGTYNLGKISNATFTQDHRLLLTGLSPNNSYNLRITLTRGDGYARTFENIYFNTLTVTPAAVTPNVSGFRAVPTDGGLNLNWILPVDPSVVGVRIVRSANFYESDPASGELVFEGLSINFLDSNIIPGEKYYYTIFTKDVHGNWSSGAVTTGRITPEGEEPLPEVPPLEEIPQAPNVHPLIEKLELKDFLFIQSGDSLKVKNNLVTVDGSKNLAVALKSYRVPPVLKTIAVTLVTAEENPKSFTFILRANKDNSRYEAVVAPLGDTHTYNVKITVVDFKNQGLKKIGGKMLVLGSHGWAVSGWSSLGWLALLVVIALLVVLFEKRRGHLKQI